jgi:hypothetical protein
LEQVVRQPHQAHPVALESDHQSEPSEQLAVAVVGVHLQPNRATAAPVDQAAVADLALSIRQAFRIWDKEMSAE